MSFSRNRLEILNTAGRPAVLFSHKMNVIVRAHPFNDSLTRQLIAELQEDICRMYPEPELQGKAGLYVPEDADSITKFVPESENTSGSAIKFLVAFFNADCSEEAAGCVAIKPHPRGLESLPAGAKIAELKRLYVRPNYRSRGVAQSLLEAAETEARDGLGVELLVLETGYRQLAALRVYERNGWKERATFGPYVGDGVEDGGPSVCFEKYLKS